MKNRIITIISTLFLSMLSTAQYGQSPNLGCLSDFLLFTSVGAVGNTGVSVVQGGAIGTNLGAITGFETVNCIKHNANDVTAQASLEITSIFNEIHQIPITQTLTAVNFSQGGTFPAGVYHINSAANLNADITLDAENNPNGLFIFNITGALSSAATIQIYLINGASVKNVFWNIDGAVGLGAGSSLKGTFIALAGAINLGDGSILEGRALSIAGAISINNSRISACIPPETPVISVNQPTTFTATGTISIQTPTGNGLMYSIDGNDYTNTLGVFNLVPEGTYIVTAMNQAGCISEGSIAIVNSQPINLSWIGAENENWNNELNWNPNGIPFFTTNVTISASPNQPIVNQDTTLHAFCNNLQIEPGAILRIAPGKSLSALGTLLNYGGESAFVLESNSSFSGSLFNNSFGVNATVERYITGTSQAWHFLSSPVSNQIISGNFTPIDSDFDFYAWYESEPQWVNFKNTTVSPTWQEINGPDFIPGKGYLITYELANAVKTFRGLINNGEVNFLLSYNGNSDYKYFNLIGNPYPCAIDWKASSGWDKSRLDGNEKCYWIWNDSIGNYGTYSDALTGDNGTNGTSRFISSGQGFFVLASEAGNLSMNNGIKALSQQTYLKKQGNLNPSIKLKLACESNKYSDEAIAELNNANINTGSIKFESMYPVAPEIYFINNEIKYSILQIPDMDDDITLMIGVKSGISSYYHITASEIIPGKYKYLLLEDVETGIFQDLLKNPEYRFLSPAGEKANRFKLHFNSEPNTILPLSADDYSIHYKNNTIIINSLNSTEFYTVKISNMTGIVICSHEFNGNKENTLYFSQRPSVYIVSIESKYNVFSKKIVVN